MPCGYGNVCRCDNERMHASTLSLAASIPTTTKSLCLRKLLSRLPKQDWLVAAWVIDRGRGHKGFRQPPGFNYPQQHVTAAIHEAGAIRGWEIETLTTECLAFALNLGPRVLNIRSWPAIAQLVTLLRDIGNAETGLTDPSAILRNMNRILSQQLPWQVHEHIIEDYVRWWFIFDSEKLQSIFLARMGVSVKKFCMIGLAWALVLKENPFVSCPTAESALGLTADDIKAFIKATCAPLARAVAEATAIVATGAEIDFRKSNLRQKPVVMVGDNDYFICPIWQLFLWRITSGLYYDVVADVRAPHEIGARYENELLSSVAIGLAVSGEINYGTAKRPKLSPDCIVHRAGAIEILVECKAKKLPQVAQHSMLDTRERTISIDELAKGVVQLCRFEKALHEAAVRDFRESSDGIVLVLVTLDDFIFTGSDISGAVFNRAREIALEVEERFERIEQERVTLCTATELEEICSKYAFDDIKRICTASAEKKFPQYAVVNVAMEGFRNEHRAENYPLAHLLDGLLGVPLDQIAPKSGGAP
jgi:hypothetical protein